MEKERFSAPRWAHEVDAIKIARLNGNPGQGSKLCKGSTVLHIPSWEFKT